LLVYCYYDIGDYCADCTMAIDEEIGEEDSDEFCSTGKCPKYGVLSIKKGEF